MNHQNNLFIVGFDYREWSAILFGKIVLALVQKSLQYIEEVIQKTDQIISMFEPNKYFDNTIQIENL